MQHHEEEEMMQLKNSAIYKQGRWIFQFNNNTGVYAHQVHHATNSAHVCNADWLTTRV